MSIELALADAARNSETENATITVTLRSGVQLKGKLKKTNLTDTRMMETPAGGWITFRTDEVVAVEAAPERWRG